MIAVFMGKQDAVELFGRHAALLEAEDDLARAQPAINENFAMIGRDERAVPGTAAAEHGETEHAPYLAAMFRFAQIKSRDRQLNCAISQSEDALLLGIVIERAESANFIEAAHAVERVEVLSITRSELGRFQITAAQIGVAKGIGATAGEKMKAQPATIGARNALRFAEESDEQDQH